MAGGSFLGWLGTFIGWGASVSTGGGPPGDGDGTSSNRGGGDNKRKRRFVVTDGDRVLIFANAKDAARAQQAIDDAAEGARQAIARAKSKPAAKRARRAARAAPVQAAAEFAPLAQEVVPLAQMRALADEYAARAAFERAMQANVEAAVRIWQELRDEEDDVAALLALA